jgi:bacterioferritin-associated ferredoxin
LDYDDDICVCYHVSLRKLVYFARRVRPKHPSQMSECLGAGTGCGWCIPILTKIARSVDDPNSFRLAMTPEEYAAQRAAYRDENRPRHEFE